MGWVRQRASGDKFIPFTQTFNYTGNVQSLTIPSKGLYQLEVWGSKGESATIGGGLGGHSVGYVLLDKDEFLYICCGGTPYNGGGSPTDQYSGDRYFGSCKGGGATHITKNFNLTLEAIGKSNFDSYGLIVAGGGGGGTGYWGGAGSSTGAGGGTNGGDGWTPGNSDNYAAPGTGGTQSGPGYAKNASTVARGAFGKGGNGASTEGTGYIRTAAGGGGGYYGGGGALARSYPSQGPGGGGSGWIGGVPAITYKGVTYTPMTENAVNNGTGYAIITRIA